MDESVRNVEYTINKNELTPIKNESIPKQISINKELPLNDLYLNKDDNLNPRYNFNSFVVGPFNELAYAVSQAIITNPGQNYNPFFVYGGTGLGKTHMIQAIGNIIKTKYPHKKIYYVSLERFAIDYINSIQNKNPNSFKEKYRKYDVIIMDDIQFISGKDKTQEELFHLFNTLYENNKQIVFKSKADYYEYIKYLNGQDKDNVFNYWHNSVWSSPSRIYKWYQATIDSGLHYSIIILYAAIRNRVYSWIY